MDNPDTGNIGYTRHRMQTKTQYRKLKRWATWIQPKNRGWTQVLTMGNQLLLLIRHLPCNSYSQYVLDTLKLKQTQTALNPLFYISLAELLWSVVMTHWIPYKNVFCALKSCVKMLISMMCRQYVRRGAIILWILPFSLNK